MIATRRQISMPSRLNIPCFSDSDEDAETTLWRDESPNRMDELESLPNCNLVSQIVNLDETVGELVENDCWSLQYQTLKHNEHLSSSSFSENLCVTTPSNDDVLYVPCNDALEPLLSSSNSISNLKDNEINSELENDHSSDFQTAGISGNSEYLTPLCASYDDHNQNTEEHDTPDLPLDYSDTLDTLTSSFSDQFGTLTFSNNLNSHTGLVNCDNYAESNPLLDSSSVEYSFSKDNKDPNTASCESSPYSDSSDPLTSLTDTSEPQTPSDNIASKMTYSLIQSSSLKLIKNNMNNIKRQTSLDNVANTMPLLSKGSNNDDLMKPSISYQSPKLSFHSVDSHLNGKGYKNGSTAIRRRPGRRMDKSRLKRRCSINGHYYLRETSSFTPPYGSPCSIWITSKTTAEEVLNMLLEKYKVEMSTYNFALFVVKDSGELRRIREDESPLVTRVMLGPHEDVAKVFIMDAQRTQEVSHEVAQFLNLSLAECRAILTKYEQEEMKQVKAIRKRYDDMRFFIQKRMSELRSL